MKDLLTQLTRTDIQDFIWANAEVDVQEMVLRHKEILGVPSSLIAVQIAGRRKARYKLPRWHQTRGIVYPPALNLEQSSSEITGRYKQTVLSGDHAADLTGGFGVDAFFLSQSFSNVDYVEPDAGLLPIAQHNLQLLGAHNIRFHATSAEEFLKGSRDNYDLIFVDPSRRAGARKTFRLPDASPDVVKLERDLRSRAARVLVKASPLLDLKQAYRELPSIHRLIVVAHENECKELLLFLHRDNTLSEPEIQAVVLQEGSVTTPFNFCWSEEKASAVRIGKIARYLYEPNAAILKSGAFKLVGARFGLAKLAIDSHLYTADKRRDDFPGRIFEVISRVAIEKGLHQQFKNGQANILTRNFPLSVEQLKKKTGLIEGGDDYLICTRSERPVALMAKRLR